MTVLIAEDAPEVRKLLAHWLESRGHTVVQARDGQEACGRLKDVAFVVTDYEMPRLNGVQLAQVVSHYGIPFIVMSGNGPKAVKELRECGLPLMFQRVLEKPFDFEELREAALVLGVKL